VRVTAEDVATARKGGPAPLLALLSPYLLPATVVVALLLLVGLVLWYRQRQPRAR
jgi:fructose 5-dehydrogenase cytochrome subunit